MFTNLFEVFFYVNNKDGQITQEIYIINYSFVISVSILIKLPSFTIKTNLFIQLGAQKVIILC